MLLPQIQVVGAVIWHFPRMLPLRFLKLVLVIMGKRTDSVWRDTARDPILLFVAVSVFANAWVLVTGRTAILFDYSRPVALCMLVFFCHDVLVHTAGTDARDSTRTPSLQRHHRLELRCRSSPDCRDRMKIQP